LLIAVADNSRFGDDLRLTKPHNHFIKSSHYSGECRPHTALGELPGMLAGVVLADAIFTPTFGAGN
jgi:hypothetical protein